MKLLIILAVISSTHSIIFECKYGIGLYDNIGGIYRCHAASFIGEDIQTLHAVNRDESGKSNLDVKGVYLNFNGTNIDYIPKGLEDFFPNIIVIIISGGNITKLNGDELNAYENLEYFGIKDNPLESVPGNLFSKNRKLKSVDFCRNKIRFVDPQLLNGLYRLNRVHFEGNICINEKADYAHAIPFVREILGYDCHANKSELTTRNYDNLRWRLD